MREKTLHSPILAIILVLFIITSVSCRKTKIQSEAAIFELKRGVVLVRLQTLELKISILKEANKLLAVKQVENDLKARNLEIIAAFKKHFEFCPVYFFYSNYSNRIRNNKLDSIFVNDRLEIDTRLKPDPENVFILDVGNIHFQAFGGSTEGILVMNKQFESLERPFPYYVRRTKPIPILSKRLAEMVDELNYKLNKYYQKHKFK